MGAFAHGAGNALSFGLTDEVIRRTDRQYYDMLNRASAYHPIVDELGQMTGAGVWTWAAAGGAGERTSPNRSPTEGSTGRTPQGLTKDSFDTGSKLIRDTVGGISDDIVVQGSRAGGTATSASDIDFAIRVPKEQFDALVKQFFKSPNPGSAAERTMNYSINNGIIQSGEAKLRGLRLELEQLFGIDVDISIILKDGPFDNGYMIKLP